MHSLFVPRLRYLSAAVCFILAASTTACESLLDVSAPSRVPVDEAFRPGNADILMNSVVTQFECTFGSAVVEGASLGDEFGNASVNVNTFATDRRDMTAAANIGAGACGVFGGAAVTRFLAEEFRIGLESWTDAQVPNRGQYLARTAAYLGYAYLLFGEMMCTGTVDGGSELTKAQIFALAEERFTFAIGASQGVAALADVLNMSRVGRARTRLNLTNLTGASADAALVPIGFIKTTSYTASRPNPVFATNNQGASLTVGPVYRNFTFAGVPDPRVPVTDANRLGLDATTPLFVQGKYTSLTSQIAIAKWQEARLIVAEAALAAGDVTTPVNIINELHAATNPPLPAFNSTDPAVIRDQIIYERRAELFLESQNLYDAVRYSLPFVPVAGTPFPTGGGFYGSQRCFLLPDVERTTNPNVAG